MHIVFGIDDAFVSYHILNFSEGSVLGDFYACFKSTECLKTNGLLIRSFLSLNGSFALVPENLSSTALCTELFSKSTEFLDL